jgi:hypothetical protein
MSFCPNQDLCILLDGILDVIFYKSWFLLSYAYSFMRPKVFNDDQKLIEYFKNMLIAKGKEN